MPPTSTPNGNGAPSEDLGGLLKQERLPSGLGDLAEPLIAHSQRERILIAIAESCARKGYGATTIADIVEPAGVSRATFYELFKDKEDCFHAAMEVSLADAMGRIVAAYSPDKPWATMVRDAAAALLDLLARRPAFARMALVEAPSSGERAFELYASGKRVLQALLDRGRDDPVEEEAIPSSAGRAALFEEGRDFAPAGRDLPANTSRMAIGGVAGLIADELAEGRAEQLPGLLFDLLFATLIPYIGPDAAAREVGEAT